MPLCRSDLFIGSFVDVYFIGGQLKSSNTIASIKIMHFDIIAKKTISITLFNVPFIKLWYLSKVHFFRNSIIPFNKIMDHNWKRKSSQCFQINPACHDSFFTATNYANVGVTIYEEYFFVVF
jgi:hypothetical protein